MRQCGSGRGRPRQHAAVSARRGALAPPRPRPSSPQLSDPLPLPSPPPSPLPSPAPVAYFFTRSILICIRTLEGKDTSPFDTEWKGWVLVGFFFVDAWLLGECKRAG